MPHPIPDPPIQMANARTSDQSAPRLPSRDSPEHERLCQHLMGIPNQHTTLVTLADLSIYEPISK